LTRAMAPITMQVVRPWDTCEPAGKWKLREQTLET
jgi:hypothetical protein